MSTLTDPARELADLCYILHEANQNHPGSQSLAEKFNVSPWSAEFYQIVFIISQRVEALKLLVDSLDNIDDDLKSAAGTNLDMIGQAFTQNGLNNAWSHSVNNFISPEHVAPIRMLSPVVRMVQSYPKLDKDEHTELLGVVDELLGWLNEHQINDQDFIRQAIIDGLEGFRFRVERVQWVGWGYTLESLREVIGAYLVLERGLDPQTAPDAAAVLKKVGNGMKWIFSKVGVVKDTTETGQWLLEGYKNISGLALAAKGAMLLLGAS